MRLIKVICTLLLTFMTTVLCRAQLPEHGDWRERVGNVNPHKAKLLYARFWGKDSPILMGNETKPVDIAFYIDFKQLTSLAPYCDYFFYTGQLYETSSSMYQRMLDSIADPAIRMMLVEDVVEHGKVYVDHIDSINVLRELNTSTKGDPLTMSLAKIKRAHYNYMFAHNPKYYPTQFYDKEKAYYMYRDAFKDFLAAKGEQGKELEGRFVLEYYNVCQDLYKSNEEKYYEQFLSDYQEIVNVCDKLLLPYYDVADSIKRNDKLFNDYNYTTYGCEIVDCDTIIKGQFIEYKDTIPIGVRMQFAASGAASADRLRAYYAPRLEANRYNKEYLDRAIHFMYENGFTNDTAFFDYCKASYELGKTYENCIGLAASSQFGLVNKSEMRKYYEDALQLSGSEVDKAKIRYFMARSLFTPRPQYPEVNAKGDTVMQKREVRGSDGSLVIKNVPKYVNYPYTSPQYQQWQNELTMCNANLKEMLKSSEVLLKDSRIDIRDYVAQAYYMMGVNGYVRSAQLHSLELADESVRYLKNAERLKMRASHINGRTANVSEYIGKFTGLRNEISEKLRDKAKREKWQRDYDEYLRKKKAEEDFWMQK